MFFIATLFIIVYYFLILNCQLFKHLCSSCCLFVNCRLSIQKRLTSTQWEGRRGSANVEDRRGERGFFSGRTGCGLGGGLSTIIIVLIYMALGGNPLQLIGVLGGNQNTQEYTQSFQSYTHAPQEERMAQFVSVVLADTEDVWTEIFSQAGRIYRKPTLVLFTGYTTSACGTAQSATGPFYCSEDEKIYVDLSFFQQMETQFKAGGDFAFAYVIAHEVGHHVQKLLGTLNQIHTLTTQTDNRSTNALSVALELQADFYAGVWANRTEQMFQNLDDGDIDEALNAASAIGDDRLQEQSQGYIIPDSFTHGSSQQRHDWFYKGYRTGDINQGNTFWSLFN